MTPVRARDNPFATHRIETLGYRGPRTGEPFDPARLLERLETLDRRAAIMGPEGSGKTTLLDDLEPLLEARGQWVWRLRAATDPAKASGKLVEDGNRSRIVEPRDALAACGPATTLVIDGADRLKPRIWRKVRAGSDALLITAHRPGLLPTLTECSTSPELLARLIAELLEGSDTPSPPLLPSPEELHARHRGNLRTALLELYDRYAAGR